MKYPNHWPKPIAPNNCTNIALAAIVLMAVMVGAVFAPLVIGGSPAIPIVLFVALAAVFYLRRDQLEDVRAKYLR